MKYNFDDIIERRGTGSGKWETYHPDVIPLWVADMDFAVAKEVQDALLKRANHGVFGYSARKLPELLETICMRTKKLYNWEISAEQIIFFPGLGSALNACCRAFGNPGDEVLVQPPIYFPFMDAIKNQNKSVNHAPLIRNDNSNHIEYEIDYDQLEASINTNTKLFLLSNPHNPVGKMYNKDQLTKLATIAERNDLIICSDEIHCELILDSKKHYPTATISDSIAARCITLMAPSKTFNLAGLSCGYAIIQNPDLMLQVREASAGIIPGVNVMGYTAALSAFQHGDIWLQQLLEYLSGNRDYVIQYIDRHMPNIRTTCPEATYLMWLDCSEVDLPEENPQLFFLANAKVALSDGVMFGPGGDGFVRMNLACPRSVLETALTRMRNAINQL